jgi:hypothetical protein
MIATQHQTHALRRGFFISGLKSLFNPVYHLYLLSIRNLEPLWGFLILKAPHGGKEFEMESSIEKQLNELHNSIREDLASLERGVETALDWVEYDCNGLIKLEGMIAFTNGYFGDHYGVNRTETKIKNTSHPQTKT